MSNYMVLIAAMMSALNVSDASDRTLAHRNASVWSRICARRDAVLKTAAEQRLQHDAICKLMLPIFGEAFERGVAERRAILGADKNHFCNATNPSQGIQAEVAAIMHSNALYRGKKTTDVGILDIYKIDFSRYYRGTSPLFLIHSPQVYPLLKKLFPHVKAVIGFDPRSVLTQAQLDSAVGHELAHMMQRTVHVQKGQACLWQFIEVDADIKNICTQYHDGSWRLREHALQLIENFYSLLVQEDIYAIDKLTADLEGTKKTEMEALCYGALRLYRIDHPTCQDRKDYLYEVVALMDSMDGSMSDTEFVAMIGIIAARVCVAMQLTVNNEFLELAQLEKARTLPRIMQYMQIPHVTVSNQRYNTRARDFQVHANQNRFFCCALP